MKKTGILIATFVAPKFLREAGAYQNGGRSIDEVRLGTHDFLASKAWELYEKTASSRLVHNFDEKIYLLATEVPDHSSSFSISGLPSEYNNCYNDRRNHRVGFTPDGEPIESSPAIRRAREEFRKARSSFQAGKYRECIFFLGCLSHYLFDVSGWPHIEEGEDQQDHRAFETAIEKHIRNGNCDLDVMLQDFGESWPIEAGDAVRQVAVNAYDPGDGMYTSREMRANLVKTGRTTSCVEAWDDNYLRTAEYCMAFAVHRMAGVLANFNEYGFDISNYLRRLLGCRYRE